MSVTKHSFKVSSAVKNLLGKDLLTNKYVAILELVKNSYDAGSSDVWVIFDHKNSEGGVQCIKIIDNGSGMSREDILEKWLVVGYSEKLEGMTSSSLGVEGWKSEGRTMAGQKGIGRLSCDTLGEKLLMTTTKDGSDELLRFKVDWTAFEKDQKTEFQKIEVELEGLPKSAIRLPSGQSSARGTILEITNPRDEWTHQHLEKLSQYLQRMVNPYFSGSSDVFNVTLQASAFSEYDRKLEMEIREKESKNVDYIHAGHRPVNGKIRNTVIDEIKELTTRISSEIKDQKIKTTLYDKERMIYSIVELNPFRLLDDCKVDIFFLNTYAKRKFTSRMGVRPVNFGSIYVYKNYFRVLPYGDEGNDWLGLDRQKQQGYARFLSTREIIGRVSIRDNTGRFKEASSREGGFIRNQAFMDLQDFVKKVVIDRLTKFVVNAIKWDRKNAPSQEDRRIQSLKVVTGLIGNSVNNPPVELNIGPDILSIVEEKLMRDIPDVVTELESIGTNLPEQDLSDAIVERVKLLRVAVERLQREFEGSKREALFMAKAKSTEDFSKSILHEVKQSAPSISKALTRVIYFLDGINAPRNVREDLHYSLVRTQRIEQISRIGSLANFSTMSNKITESVSKFIIDYIKWAADKATDMKMESTFKGIEVNTKKKFSPLELTIILDNLWTNAYKAAATKVYFSFHPEQDKVVILISDNGLGVDPEAFEKLFTKGFSTRGGSGIGLYSSRYLAEANGWELSFVGNNEKDQGSGACFRLVI